MTKVTRGTSTCTRLVLRSINPSVFHTAACLISDCTDSFSLERISSSSWGSSSLSELFSAELSSIRHYTNNKTSQWIEKLVSLTLTTKLRLFHLCMVNLN